MGNEDQAKWIGRVLGVELPGATKISASPDVLATWRDAKEAVDDRINVLASELKSFGDPELARIGEFGLFGITDTETVALNAALFDYQRASGAGRDAAAAKVRSSIKAYRAAVDGNEIVHLIDTAPFDTKVDLRGTMFSALARIESSLAA